MKKTAFPIIALFIGIFIQIVLKIAISENGETAMPLLTLLLMTEFGMIVCIVGVIMGGKSLLNKTGFDIKLALTVTGCAALAILLGIEGLDLWNYVNSIG
ncbi:MAG: hypothetical protein L3J89_04200 [Gammaproteobacteria bacterium]|nr:hypothetical protein [Gammaproteobacteria bacterium]